MGPPYDFWPLAAAFELPPPLSGFGAGSPMARIFANKSDICIPDNVSNKAGICAAMLTMSPVTLFMPAEVPLPV